MILEATPEPIANFHCACGENPLWDPERGLIYWTDIPNGRLFRYSLETGESEPFYEGDVTGGFTLQADGSLLLFQVKRITRLADGREEPLMEGIDGAEDRFNDVIADPRGRVYAGTFCSNHERGGLFRVDPDGTITCLFRGTGCSNGMGFSPDRKWFYWTCSTSRQIFRFDYNEDTGELSNRELFVRLADDEEGTVDGMTVDVEGNVWSAIWDGYGVRKYGPDGRYLGIVPFPVAKTSSALFGGPGLGQLYVTTAGGSLESGTEDGTLYRVDVGVKGMPEFRSRVLL